MGRNERSQLPNEFRRCDSSISSSTLLGLVESDEWTRTLGGRFIVSPVGKGIVSLVLSYAGEQGRDGGGEPSGAMTIGIVCVAIVRVDGGSIIRCVTMTTADESWTDGKGVY